jgi:hypothetical protein
MRRCFRGRILYAYRTYPSSTNSRQAQTMPKATPARIVCGDCNFVQKDSPGNRKSENLVIAVPPPAYSMKTGEAVHFGTGAYEST